MGAGGECINNVSTVCTYTVEWTYTVESARRLRGEGGLVLGDMRKASTVYGSSHEVLTPRKRIRTMPPRVL